jgi:hypothetical protein
MKVFTRGALLIVVALAAESSLGAQQWTCYAIQPGDTAAHAATRITGSARNRHQPWFQIFDPAAARFVAKAQYDHIRPGWRACVPIEFVRTAPPEVITGMAGIPIDPSIAVIVLVVTISFVGYVADRYWTDRQAVVDVLTRFGDAFVREFERPLIEARAPGRALRSRLRVRPHQGHVDVLLAPAGARTYPNLSDHRKNVAYDTERVLQVLQDPPFASGPPHQRGEWVIIPFQFKLREPQGGAS